MEKDRETSSGDGGKQVNNNQVTVKRLRNRAKQKSKENQSGRRTSRKKVSRQQSINMMKSQRKFPTKNSKSNRKTDKRKKKQKSGKANSKRKSSKQSIEEQEQKDSTHQKNKTAYGTIKAPANVNGRKQKAPLRTEEKPSNSSKSVSKLSEGQNQELKDSNVKYKPGKDGPKKKGMQRKSLIGRCRWSCMHKETGEYMQVRRYDYCSRLYIHPLT